VLGARFSARFHRDVPVPMRDGTVLRADVWIPDRAERVPVLLERMPYDKSISAITTVEAGLDPLRALDAGYAVVVQDTRGRFTSDGIFDPYVNEVRDGVDTIQWCADLPFSNGRVGMFGASYFGATQLLAATAAPPALQALVPTITGSDFYEGWTYQGGAFQLGLAQIWALLILAPDVIARMPAKERPIFEKALSEALRDPLQTYGRLPLSDLGGLEEVMPFYRDWLSHDTRDEYWRALAPNESYAAFRTPALHIGGWYDLFVAGTIENFTGLRQGAATTGARDGQRLLVGPWAHGNFSDTIGDLSFGIHSAKNALDATAIHLAFFDEHLRDLSREGPRVRYFLMGANKWLEEEDWPPAGSRPEVWFLHSRGQANTAAGDGVLSQEPCSGDEPADGYVYDPSDPVPTLGGATFLPGALVSHNAGAKEQSSVERRPDVLVYTSLPLDSDLDVAGPVEVTLSIATSAPGTDFTAKLVDVGLDGKAYVVCDGILSLRPGDDTRAGGHAVPGEVEKITIQLGPTAMRFGRGHRLRLDVSSSNFPRFARNPNSEVPATEARASDFRRARQRVFHDASRASSVKLLVQR
jgi:uncharacterized protein